MKKYYRVVIPPTAKESLQEIVKHIKQDSPTAAIKVRKTLLEKAKSLKELPERFSREPFLIDKPGNYRSVTVWHYKIVYKILDDEIVILKFFHTSQDPEVLRKIAKDD